MFLLTSQITAGSSVSSCACSIGLLMMSISTAAAAALVSRVLLSKALIAKKQDTMDDRNDNDYTNRTSNSITVNANIVTTIRFTGMNKAGDEYSEHFGDELQHKHGTIECAVRGK